MRLGSLVNWFGRMIPHSVPRPVAAMAVGSAAFSAACSGGGACVTLALGAATGAGLAWCFLKMIGGAGRGRFTSQRARAMNDYLRGMSSPQSPLDAETTRVLNDVSAQCVSSEATPDGVRNSISIVIPRMQLGVPLARLRHADADAIHAVLKRLPEMLQGVNGAVSSHDGKEKLFS